MDGEVIIKANLDTEDIDKGIASIEAKMNKLEKKAKEVFELEVNGRKIRTEGGWNLTEEEQKYYDRLQASLNKLQMKKSQILDIDEKIANVEEEQAIQQQNISNDVNKWIDGVYVAQDGTRYIKKDTSEINNEIKKINLNFDKIGKSMTTITKKAIRWGLAIFSIRSAYMLIRRAVSTLAQEDDKIATDIKFIQYSLAQVLKPIVEFLIRAVYKLLGIINFIYSKLFGTNLFTKEMVGGFNKANQSANKLRKTLAGFDEMNILNEDGSVGAASTGLKVDFDPNASNKEIEDWINKISQKFFDFGKEVSSYLSNPKLWENAYGVWDKFMHGITKMFYGVYEVIRGFVNSVSGVVLIIVGIFTGNFDLIKAGAKLFIQGLGDTFNGLIDIVGGIGETIAGIIKVIYTSLINGITNGVKEAWEMVKDILKPVTSWIENNVINPIKNAFNKLPNWAKKLIISIADIWIGILNTLIDGINTILIPLRAAIWAMGKISGKDWTMEDIKIPRIPLLAKGGIINQPSRGVPIGGAIAGERGAEGVIPLTDSQQMAILGEAIGKYVTINATITNTMNGRVISKELQKINNESDFAFNR